MSKFLAAATVLIIQMEPAQCFPCATNVLPTGLYGVPSADFAPQNRIICMGADVSGNSPGSPRACS
jgi:hypothetical protein